MTKFVWITQRFANSKPQKKNVKFSLCKSEKIFVTITARRFYNSRRSLAVCYESDTPILLKPANMFLGCRKKKSIKIVLWMKSRRRDEKTSVRNLNTNFSYWKRFFDPFGCRRGYIDERRSKITWNSSSGRHWPTLLLRRIRAQFPWNFHARTGEFQSRRVGECDSNVSADFRRTSMKISTFTSRYSTDRVQFRSEFVRNARHSS